MGTAEAPSHPPQGLHAVDAHQLAVQVQQWPARVALPPQPVPAPASHVTSHKSAASQGHKPQAKRKEVQSTWTGRGGKGKGGGMAPTSLMAASV